MNGGGERGAYGGLTQLGVEVLVPGAVMWSIGGGCRGEELTAAPDVQDRARASRADLLSQLLSALPAWTRGAAVWNPTTTTHTRVSHSSIARQPRNLRGATHGSATSRSSLFAAISSASRVFHVSSTSAEGAQPRDAGG